jgi:RNA polymerase sigma-70 factor (ECF subfamily)
MPSRAEPNWLDDFQALVERHQAAVYRVAYRLAGKREDAEDLVQESLIEAFQAFDRFRIGTRFDRWVFNIMTRTYIDKFRRRKRLSTVSFEEVSDERNPTQPADSTADPQQVLDRETWSESVQVGLNRLPPEFRAVVVLCDAQGFSYEEASRALRCPVGTVRSRLHRARGQLRTWLRQIVQTKEQ